MDSEKHIKGLSHVDRWFREGKRRESRNGIDDEDQMEGFSLKGLGERCNGVLRRSEYLERSTKTIGPFRHNVVSFLGA